MMQIGDKEASCWAFVTCIFVMFCFLCFFTQHRSTISVFQLLFLSLTCNHRLDAAIVAHKLTVVSFLHDTSLHGACHHCTPA